MFQNQVWVFDHGIKGEAFRDTMINRVAKKLWICGYHPWRRFTIFMRSVRKVSTLNQRISAKSAETRKEKPIFNDIIYMFCNLKALFDEKLKNWNFTRRKVEHFLQLWWSISCGTSFWNGFSNERQLTLWELYMHGDVYDTQWRLYLFNWHKWNTSICQELWRDCARTMQIYYRPCNRLRHLDCRDSRVN